MRPRHRDNARHRPSHHRWAGRVRRRDAATLAAQGWHTIQMAVLGFLGICGVLRGSSSSIRSAVQRLPAILARPLGHRAPKYRPQRDRLPTPCSIASPSRGRAAQPDPSCGSRGPRSRCGRWARIASPSVRWSRRRSSPGWRRRSRPRTRRLSGSGRRQESKGTDALLHRSPSGSGAIGGDTPSQAAHHQEPAASLATTFARIGSSPQSRSLPGAPRRY